MKPGVFQWTPQLQRLIYLRQPHYLSTYPVYGPIRDSRMRNEMQTKDDYNSPQLYVHTKSTNNSIVKWQTFTF